MTNAEFILQHRTEDVRKLALRKMPEGLDAPFCLQQIEGWQLARKKIPQWAATDGLLYPVRLSMEQCSSQQTALYKRSVVERLLQGSTDRMADLTGGFGIDFSYIAPLFREAIYVERQEQLCRIASHNFALLGLKHARILNARSEEALKDIGNTSLLYADPARRDSAGRKVVLLQDCQPDVVSLQDELMAHANVVLLKLSPMLDIQQALRQLRHVREVHVVSADGECKELLLVLHRKEEPLRYHCVNITDPVQEIIVEEGTFRPVICQQEGTYLYEPNASILKAGVQDALCNIYKVQKLHPFSHLFTSDHLIGAFPGRRFRVLGRSDFSRRGLGELLAGIRQANITVRNFPATVQELRKKLKLSDGGCVYLFATTMQDESHTLLKCEKC